MMLRRRYGRPGLVGTMARTAVVAGTATAVSNRVTEHQAAKQQQRADEQYAQQQADYPPPAEPQPAQDLIERLKQLGELHQQGVLSDDEFAAMKAKIIGG